MRTSVDRSHPARGGSAVSAARADQEAGRVPAGASPPIGRAEELKVRLNHFHTPILDHLIVGGNGYFSFAREGLLNR